MADDDDGGLSTDSNTPLHNSRIDERLALSLHLSSELPGVSSGNDYDHDYSIETLYCEAASIHF